MRLFTKKRTIESRGLEVEVWPQDKEHYEIVFAGKESEDAYTKNEIPDQIIRLWDVSEDIEGVQAEKILNVVTLLLSKGKSLKEVYADVMLLRDEFDNQNIHNNDMIQKMLR